MSGPPVPLLDGIAAILLLAGAGVGFVRGSGWMAIRLGTLAAAYLVTRWFSRAAGEFLMLHLAMSPRAAGLFGAALLFLGVLSAGAILALLWKVGSRKRKPDGWSRLVGAACGAGATVVLLAVGLVVAAPWIPRDRSRSLFRRSRVARGSVLALGEVPFVLPPSLRPQLTELVRHARRAASDRPPQIPPPAPAESADPSPTSAPSPSAGQSSSTGAS